MRPSQQGWWHWSCKMSGTQFASTTSKVGPGRFGWAALREPASDPRQRQCSMLGRRILCSAAKSSCLALSQCWTDQTEVLEPEWCMFGKQLQHFQKWSPLFLGWCSSCRTVSWCVRTVCLGILRKSIWRRRTCHCPPWLPLPGGYWVLLYSGRSCLAQQIPSRW